MPITEKEEQIIRDSFHPKSWNDIKTHNSWSVFKIMAEFVEGMEKMSKIGPCVAIFGSARTKPGDKYYEMSVEIAEKLADYGFGTITGGGPGIMEAGNKGAYQGEPPAWDSTSTCLRATLQPLYRPRQEHQLRLLLRPQDHLHALRTRLHRHAWRLRHLGRAL
jgi:Predicted Rossmann fold nucleotide-binding protein